MGAVINATAGLGSRTIPDDAYPGLDPEWRALWNTHGSHIVRSDEVTLEEYRKDPAKYSFSYATHAGKPLCRDGRRALQKSGKKREYI